MLNIISFSLLNNMVMDKYIVSKILRIMSFTAIYEIPGKLILIDFEKAFDSMSRLFIYINFFFGFREYIIQWIKF